MDTIGAEWAKLDKAELVLENSSGRFGELFDDAAWGSKPLGTHKVAMAAMGLALDYEDVCLHHNDVPQTLDDWFVGDLAITLPRRLRHDMTPSH